jgi:hypothetical protein
VTFSGQHLGGFVTMQFVQGAGVVRRFEVVGKRHAVPLRLTLAHGFEFVATLSDELVFVDGR